MKIPRTARRTPAVCIIALLFSLATCGAGLKFSNARVELKAKPADTEVIGEFEFKNTGKESVGVAKIESTCGCLSATADQKVYEPGASGTVRGVFKLGKFTGVQEKALILVTSEEKPVRHRLVVQVEIPDVFTIEPDVLEWKVQDKPETKSFLIKVPHVDPIRITKIAPSRQNFQYELKTVEEGREYEIKLTPESTETAMLGVLRIETDCPIPKHSRQMAFFSITKPRPARRK